MESNNLTHAGISVGSTAAYCKLGNGTVRNLCQDTVYTHPTSKVCNYTYTHPATKQCNYTPDLSNYATKSELASVTSPIVHLATFTGSSQMSQFTNTTYSLFIFTTTFSLTSIAFSYVRISDLWGTELTLSNTNKETTSYTIYFSRGATDIIRVEYLYGVDTIEHRVYKFNISRGALNLSVSGQITFSANLYALA